MTEPIQDSSQFTRRLVIAVGCFGVLMSLIAAWFMMTTRNPAANYTRPKTPTPNAYDYYVRAGYAIKDTDEIDRAQGGLRSYSLAEKEALLKANTQALALLQRGFTHDYLHPAVRTNRAAMDMWQSYNHIRSLARLKRLEGDVRGERGQWGGALKSHLDVVRLGKDLPRGGGIMSLLVGIAMEYIGRRGTWKIVDHLDAAEAKAASKRLQGILADHVTIPETLLEEGVEYHALLRDASGKVPSNKTLMRLRMRLDVWVLDTCATPWTSDSKESFAVRRREDARSFLKRVIPWSSMKMSTYAEGTCKALDNSARDALLATVLALHAYRLEHDGYPAKLSDLVPTYLKEIPGDPFSPADQLHYRQAGGRYVLYSIGPDGQDNGGRSISPRRSGGRPRFVPVEPDSKGDLVAGADIF